MPTMTNEDVVRAVMELQEFAGALVSTAEIPQWCKRQRPPIDYGPGIPGANNKLFWKADHDEARGEHRLLKFKEDSTTGASRAHLALRLNAKRAPASASGHPGRAQARQRGWVECRWLPGANKGRGNWDWKNAKVPSP